jgi:hypothetical protein
VDVPAKLIGMDDKAKLVKVAMLISKQVRIRRRGDRRGPHERGEAGALA